MLGLFLLLVRQSALLVEESPFKEAAGVRALGVHGIDGEVVPVDSVNDRNRESCPVFMNRGQKWWKPIVADLQDKVY